jgi:hypothetical protein
MGGNVMTQGLINDFNPSTQFQKINKTKERLVEAFLNKMFPSDRPQTLSYIQFFHNSSNRTQ